MLKNIKVFKNIKPDRQWSGTAMLTLLVAALAASAWVPSGISNASPTATAQALTPPAGSISTGDGTWYWQNNRPQGNIINSLSCPAADTCYAAGNAGTLLKTTDGGTTWASQNPNTADNLRGISCSNQLTCMTVGENSTIAVTTNGGNTWNRRFFNGLNQTLHSVNCPTANTCYVSGARILLATANLGTSWTANVQTGDFFGITCPGGGTCFTVGSAGTIKFTANAGSSWSSQTVSPATGADLLSVACLNTLNCYAVGTGGALIKTTNGTAWSPITGTGIASSLYGISCLDINNCTAVGGGSDASIYTTSNAGVSWQAQETYAPTMRAVVCTSLTNCYVGGDNGTLLTRKTALSTWTPHTQTSSFNFTDVSCPSPAYCAAVAGLSLYSSTNSGVTWNSDATYTLRNNILDVSCTDNNNCAAVGYDGYVYYRSSGGGWLEGTRLNASTSLYDVDCLPAAGLPTCYATAGIGITSRIFKSTNGGASYAPVYSPVVSSPEDVTLTAISCPQLNTCYAVGANGIILKGSDTTWTSQYNSTGVTLSGISCPDSNTCYATGLNVGYIIGTHDGGATWNLLNSPGGVVSADLDDIDCPSLTVCQAVGNAGTMVSTVDGGRTWITQFRKPNGPVISQDLNAISCPSDSFCVGVGSSLSSFFSTNADLGWKGQPLGPKMSLNAAACPSANNCYVAGTTTALYTKDAANWTVLDADTLVDISCPTTTDCYAPVGNSSNIFVTHNGGASWATQSLGGVSLNSISCPAGACFGAGGAGTIVSYNGSSWVSQPKVVNFDLNGISCPAAGVCFAVGFNTNFVYLSGGTWTSRPLGGSYGLTNINCPDTSTCYAPTINGNVLMTKDGGTTWTLKPTGFSSTLHDISCPTASDCVTTGTSGVIFATRDGGNSWVKHASGTTNALHGVTCVSVSYCVAAGDNGTLLVGSVIHSLVVTSSADNGQGSAFGTLSYALKYARPGQAISFDTSIQASGVTASSGLPQMPYGSSLVGSCLANPKYTVYGGVGVAPLELSGGNTIDGINFRQIGLKTTGTGNKLSCTGVNKNPA